MISGTNIDALVGESLCFFQKSFQVPLGATHRSEELLTHVIVQAGDIRSDGIIVPNSSRTDKAARAGNQNFHACTLDREFNQGKNVDRRF
jgi:hypothetical protein